MIFFWAIFIVGINAFLVVFLWQQRMVQVQAILRIEEQSLKAEIDQIRENAERIAHSLHSAMFRDPAGPYEHVDEFTRELEMYGMDFGWIILLEGSVAKPWIDGRKRLVLSSPRNDFSSRVAEDLTQRPWPQAEEGSARTYSFAEREPHGRIVFLEAFPLYAGSNRVGYVLVGRVFSRDSALGETLRTQISASASSIENFGVVYGGAEIFRVSGHVPGFFHDVVESQSSAGSTLGSQKPQGMKLRAYTRRRDLLALVAACFFLSALGVAVGIFAIGTWTRKSVSTLLQPLQHLVDGTTLLAKGDFSARVREPSEEELRLLAQKFNFFAASLQQTLQELAEAARKEEEGRRRAVEAEVIQLRSQLQPHFLFNSLSMVAETILENPQRAHEMTLSLAELFHAILRSSTKISHSLEEELKLLGAYLHLQSMRFEGRLTYSLPSSPFEFSLDVPCLAIQNMVENAIKHGIAPLRGGGHVAVRLETSQGFRHVLVENNGVPMPQNIVEGTGVKNTRRRWCLLHGEKARLVLEVAPCGTSRAAFVAPVGAEVLS